MGKFMKKSIFFICLIFISAIAMVVYAVSFKMDNNNFGKDLGYFVYEDDKYPITAIYQGKETKITNQNKSKLVGVLCSGGSERKKVLFDQDYELDSIEFVFGTEVTITVFQTLETEDKVFFRYINHVKDTRKYFTLEGYQIFKETLAIVNSETK